MTVDGGKDKKVDTQKPAVKVEVKKVEPKVVQKGTEKADFDDEFGDFDEDIKPAPAKKPAEQEKKPAGEIKVAKQGGTELSNVADSQSKVIAKGVKTSDSATETLKSGKDVKQESDKRDQEKLITEKDQKIKLEVGRYIKQSNKVSDTGPGIKKETNKQIQVKLQLLQDDKTDQNKEPDSKKENPAVSKTIIPDQKDKVSGLDQQNEDKKKNTQPDLEQLKTSKQPESNKKDKDGIVNMTSDSKHDDQGDVYGREAEEGQQDDEAKDEEDPETLAIKQSSEYLHLKTRNDRLVKEVQETGDSAKQLLLREQKAREARHVQVDANPHVANLMSILAEQKQTIRDLKEESRHRQKTLENVYNYGEVVDRENELTDLKRQLEKILAEKHSLHEIARQQEGELKRGEMDETAKREFNDLALELSRRKEDHRRLQEENRQLDKHIGDNHNIIIVLSKKYQDAKKRAKQLKPVFLKESKKPSRETELEDLEAEYEQLVARRAEVNQTFELERKAYEQAYKQLKTENILTGKALAEKNKEVILNSIKLKKLKRETPEQYARDLQRQKLLQRSAEKVHR